MDAPVSSATDSHAFARARPRFPNASGYAFRFRTIVGRRIGDGNAEGAQIGWHPRDGPGQPRFSS